MSAAPAIAIGPLNCRTPRLLTAFSIDSFLVPQELDQATKFTNKFAQTDNNLREFAQRNASVRYLSEGLLMVSAKKRFSFSL